MSNSRFSFMVWNLFLAWLPVLWALLLVRGLKHYRWLSWGNVLFSILWLIFLPNSFYMITDFIHLGTSTAHTMLYDSVLFLNFALAGILTGCISIYYVHCELAKRLARDTVILMLAGCFLLNGLAIFLGRNLGWNSWDIIINPFLVLSSFGDQLTGMGVQARMIGITMLFLVFVSVCYTAFYFFMSNFAASGSGNKKLQR